MSVLRAKKSPHCGRFEETPAHLMAGFHLQAFFASVKVLPCRYLLQSPPFSFAQNWGKFAPNCLALQLLHLLRKAAHKGKQGAKKGEPFNGSPCHVVFCSVHSYTLLMKATPNTIVFSKNFALWQNTFSLSNSLSKTKFVL